MVKCLVMVNILNKTILSIRVISRILSSMEREFNSFKMEINFKEFMKMDFLKDSAPISGNVD